ncbi:hypothetical protein [Spirochaeta cellobiosiphila]|uniref:hypothetical protein n=1 Tax=Spirochaeta cellobiosiphila TaxID=504483 RepID=UPI0003FCD316|nr:hypothetical protein [Spirochaeta cellobiosiphila]
MITLKDSELILESLLTQRDCWEISQIDQIINKVVINFPFESDETDMINSILDRVKQYYKPTKELIITEENRDTFEEEINKISRFEDLHIQLRCPIPKIRLDKKIKLRSIWIFSPESLHFLNNIESVAYLRLAELNKKCEFVLPFNIGELEIFGTFYDDSIFNNTIINKIRLTGGSTIALEGIANTSNLYELEIFKNSRVDERSLNFINEIPSIKYLMLDYLPKIQDFRWLHNNELRFLYIGFLSKLGSLNGLENNKKLTRIAFYRGLENLFMNLLKLKQIDFLYTSDNLYNKIAELKKSFLIDNRFNKNIIYKRIVNT